MDGENSMDLEGTNQAIPAHELENDEFIQRSLLNPNAQPFIPSAASLLSSSSVDPNISANQNASAIPDVSSINLNASNSQPINPNAPITEPIIPSAMNNQQFNGLNMESSDVPTASTSSASAPTSLPNGSIEDLFRKFLEANSAAQNPMHVLGAIKGMLRTDLSPFDPSKQGADPLNFIRNFERFAEAYKWSDQDLKFQFGNHLADKANKWFNDQNWRNQNWVQIRTKFLNRFSSQKVCTGLDDLFQLNYEDNPVQFVEALAKAHNDVITGGDFMTQVISVGFRKLPPYLAQHFAVDCPANFDAFNTRLQKLTSILKPRPKKAEVPSVSNQASAFSASFKSSKKTREAPLCPRHKAVRNQDVRHWLNECDLPAQEPSGSSVSLGQKRSYPGTSGSPAKKKFNPQVNLIEQHQQQPVVHQQQQHQQQHQQQQSTVQQPASSPSNYQLPPHLQPR